MSELARRSAAALLAVFAIVACTSAPAPTATPGEPTAVPTAEPTATPVETVPPTVEPTTDPTPTTAPTAAPTAAPTPTVAPTPTAEPAAEIVRFRREEFTEESRNVVDCADPGFPGSILLRWQVRNATGVTLSIDGPGIYDSYPGTSGEAELPFACEEPQHTYTLTTTGGIGSPASLTRTIRRGDPVIRDFAVIGPNCTSSDPVPVSVTWEIAHASGVEVWVDDVLYATYNGRTSPLEGAAAGMFDCTKASQEYRLVTSGPYGTPASMTLAGVP